MAQPPNAETAVPSASHEAVDMDDPSDNETQSSPNHGLVFRLSSSVDNLMRNSFFRLGLVVSSNPIKVIIFSLLFVAATLAGMLRFRSESRAEELWVPQGTIALKNSIYVRRFYGRSDRSSAILFKARDANVGLATKDAFLEMLKVVEDGFYIVAPPLNPGGDEFNTEVTLDDICIRTADSEGNSVCRTASPFNLFYDIKFLRYQDEDEKIVNFYATVRAKIETLTDEQIQETLNDPGAEPFDGSVFNREESFATGDSSVIQVMTYRQFSENNAISKDGESIDKEADHLEELWTTQLLDTAPGELTTWYVDSVWGQEESLSEALSGDIPLLTAGFVLLAIYVIVFLGDFHSVRSHRLLAVAALATTGIALGSCFGISSATGMFYGPVHQILPLLILGIGIDDCFHITRAVDAINRRPDAASKPIPTRVALALSSSGAAITVTSFTNVAVFLLSAVSRLPALRFFALWAAIGVFFAWVYAITFYTAFVTLDVRRIDAKRLDCVPCLKPRKEVNELNWFKKEAGGFDRFFQNQFGPFIMHRVVRIVLLCLFLAGFGASIYGCSQLYLKFRFAFFYPSGSSQREYQDGIDDFFELGDRANVYVRDSDLSTAENQKRLFDLCNPSGRIAQNAWVQRNSVDCWYATMRETVALENGDDVYAPSTFVSKVEEFLASSDGLRYNSSVLFNEERKKIQGCEFEFQYMYRESNDDEITALESVREDSDAAGFGEADGAQAAFPYTFLDTFTEQYAALPGEIGLSLGFASLAVAVVCVVLVGHPVVALVSVVVVGMIIIGVLGLTYYTGINLNSVSVITLVLCTGISVDFVVHISRSFLEHVGTRSERAIKSLGTMGAPVFYAGFSTFLAIIVLSGATSYIFRVLFLGFLFLIVLAFLHGLILGPILLSFIGPASFYTDEKDKHRQEQQLEDCFTQATRAGDSDQSDSNGGAQV